MPISQQWVKHNTTFQSHWFPGDSDDKCFIHSVLGFMIGRPIKYLLEQNKEYNPSDLFTSLLRTESSRFVFTAGRLNTDNMSYLVIFVICRNFYKTTSETIVRPYYKYYICVYNVTRRQHNSQIYDQLLIVAGYGGVWLHQLMNGL